MENIIEIIIILIVIASVMKRFREISEKSKDLETTKLPEQVFEMTDVERPQRGPTARPSPEPLDEEPEWEPFRPVKTPQSVYEDTYESLHEMLVTKSRLPESKTQAVESMPKIRAYSESPQMMRRPETLSHIPVLSFHHTQVVRGIIMSEILGPPVGLRNTGWIR